MSTKIKAKFNVQTITHHGNGGGKEIVLKPVINGSEENKEFFAATPNGEIKMHLKTENFPFEMGEYYVEFTKAD